MRFTYIFFPPFLLAALVVAQSTHPTSLSNSVSQGAPSASPSTHSAPPGTLSTSSTTHNVVSSNTTPAQSVQTSNFGDDLGVMDNVIVRPTFSNPGGFLLTVPSRSFTITSTPSATEASQFAPVPAPSVTGAAVSPAEATDIIRSLSYRLIQCGCTEGFWEAVTTSYSYGSYDAYALSTSSATETNYAIQGAADGKASAKTAEHPTGKQQRDPEYLKRIPALDEYSVLGALFQSSLSASKYGSSTPSSTTHMDFEDFVPLTVMPSKPDPSMVLSESDSSKKSKFSDFDFEVSPVADQLESSKPEATYRQGSEGSNAMADRVIPRSESSQPVIFTHKPLPSPYPCDQLKPHVVCLNLTSTIVTLGRPQVTTSIAGVSSDSGVGIGDLSAILATASPNTAIPTGINSFPTLTGNPSGTAPNTYTGKTTSSEIGATSSPIVASQAFRKMQNPMLFLVAIAVGAMIWNPFFRGSGPVQRDTQTDFEKPSGDRIPVGSSRKPKKPEGMEASRRNVWIRP